MPLETYPFLHLSLPTNSSHTAIRRLTPCIAARNCSSSVCGLGSAHLSPQYTGKAIAKLDHTFKGVLPQTSEAMV